MGLYQKLETLHPIKLPMQFESAFYLTLKIGFYFKALQVFY
ncbi:hypothetical protein HPAKL86_05230 [Helicobacter pylori Aklavik86]|uniref:Uncharacterized protein n=1 Tax=Helicobacter pylori Aklavik86 TaxID=1055532 RepID=K7Z1Y5_HELPX|nr:hypothetical protein HPAKL86_05230 [Helicobacter pylori Aklavik86]